MGVFPAEADVHAASRLLMWLPVLYWAPAVFSGAMKPFAAVRVSVGESRDIVVISGDTEALGACIA